MVGAPNSLFWKTPAVGPNPTGTLSQPLSARWNGWRRLADVWVQPASFSPPVLPAEGSRSGVVVCKIGNWAVEVRDI
jgi:hypothetical protein